MNLNTYKKIRSIVDDIIQNLYVQESDNQMITDLMLTVQIMKEIATRVANDSTISEDDFGSPEGQNASGMVALLTGKAICKGYSEILRNVLSCVGIECSSIEGIGINNEGKEEKHAWNQVKIGNIWLNVDLTLARNDILEEKDSGSLFMSDMAFFGERKWYTFNPGKVVNGESWESMVLIGGHSPHVKSAHHRPTKSYLDPFLTTRFIKQSSHYAETYRDNGNIPDYHGPVPYVGSHEEEKRSASRISTPTTPLNP